MKICNIYIKGFDQFQDVELDFTNPETGQPVDKICFIGRNGTGKSKILKIINWFFHSVLNSFKHPANLLPPLDGHQGNSRVIFKIQHKNESILIFQFWGNVEILRPQKIGSDLIKNLLSLPDPQQIRNFIAEQRLNDGLRHQDFINDLILKDNSTDLVISSPDESRNNGYFDIKDVPKTNVSDSLALFQNFPFFSQVSPDTVDVFWKLLVYNLKKRDDEREKFERAAENLNKTKAELIKEFDKLNPKILDELATIWNKILGRTGLEFDVEGASNPIQLTDNLKAYIRLKGSKRLIPYSELSTGIRNFIFRIGHIRSLYFNRQIDRGFLLVDEAENGLFPDFLFELMETYKEIVVDKNGANHTQMFFATHNPIIAAQFKPIERIILDWNDDGTVKVHKGVSPEGDDPNDILKNDFSLHELMGPIGIQNWLHYLDLKKQLKKVQSIEDKMVLASKINEIGRQYNFPL